MPDSMDLKIPVSLEPDKKSQKQTENAFKNITSLVSDLSIIGTVASRALGKLWDTLKDSIDIGVKGFGSSVDALLTGFDFEEIRKLSEALANIGANPKDATKVAGAIKGIATAFEHPELAGSEKLISELLEALNRFVTAGVLSPQDVENFKKVAETGDTEKLLNTVAALINKGGEENAIALSKALGVPQLKGLGILEQYQDWLKVLAKDLPDVDTKALDDINDAAASLKTSLATFRLKMAELSALVLPGIADVTSSLSGLFSGFIDGILDTVPIISKDLNEVIELYKQFGSSISKAFSDSEFGKFISSAIEQAQKITAERLIGGDVSTGDLQFIEDQESFIKTAKSYGFDPTQDQVLKNLTAGELFEKLKNQEAIDPIDLTKEDSSTFSGYIPKDIDALKIGEKTLSEVAKELLKPDFSYLGNTYSVGSQTFNIYQQPGEDSDALTNKIVEELNNTKTYGGAEPK